MMVVVLSKIVEFGIGFDLVFGLAFLLLNSRKLKNWCLGTLLIITAYLQFYFLLVQTQTLGNYPNLFMTYIPTIFTIGPLLLLLFQVSSDVHFRFKKHHLLHLIPIIFSIAIITPIVLQDDRVVSQTIDALFCNQGVLPFVPLSALAGLSLISYIIFILIQHPRFFPSRSGPKIKAAVPLLVALVGFSATMMVAVFNAYLSIALASFGNVFLTLGVVTLLMVYYRSPKLFDQWIYEIQEHRHKTSQLEGLNEDEISDALNELFNVERIYLDPDLTLGKLSVRMMLSVHQLSEFLNQRKGMSFAQFVNTHRVNHAKMLLVNESWRRTTSIGLESGFNSDASFNRNFKQITGESPGAYKGKVTKV